MSFAVTAAFAMVLLFAVSVRDMFRASPQMEEIVSSGGPASRKLMSGGVYPDEIFTDEEKSQGAVVLYIFGVLYTFLGLAIVCDEYFVPCLEVIVAKLGISFDVAGATFMAAGSSAPELFSSIIGTFLSSTNVGFGTIVGSAIFNVCIIIGAVAGTSSPAIKLSWYPLARDSFYYAISIAVLYWFFTNGDATYTDPEEAKEKNRALGSEKQEIVWWEGMVLVILYFGYIALMKVNTSLRAKCEKCFGGASPAEKGDEESGPESVPLSTTEEAPRGSLGRGEIKTFQAGFLNVYVKDRSIEENWGLHVVFAVQGDVYETFQRICGDNADSLNRSALLKVLKDLHTDASEADVDSILKALDHNGDGNVSFDEFQSWYLKSEARMQAEVNDAFSRVDKDNSGDVDKAELGALMKEVALNGAPGQDEIDSLWDTLEKNPVTGNVDKQAFSNWYVASPYWEKQKQAHAEQADEEEAGTLSWPDSAGARIKFLFVCPILIPLYFTLPNIQRPQRQKFGWITLNFFITVVWIAIFSYLMVWWAEVTGEVVGIPVDVMGLTFLAAGTSVPDMLASLIVNKQGEGDAAVSNSLGSNVFDILLGLGLPWLLYAAINEPVDVTSDGLVVSVAILFGVLLIVILSIALPGWKLGRPHAVLFVLLYVAFVVFNLSWTPESKPWVEPTTITSPTAAAAPTPALTLNDNSGR